jgi:CheY-like chemotaxis protein
MPHPSDLVVGSGGLVNKRILVVDDDEFVCDLVSKVLTKYLSMEVYTANNGSDAIAAALTGRYDAALIDLILPRTSGRKVIRTIKTMLPEFPIIVMSAQAPEDVTKAIRRLGITVVLQKPFKLMALIQSITEIFGSGKALPAQKINK